jgi:hypothetical protein
MQGIHKSQEFRNSRIANFVNSKAQYERQFKKWKFRKHRKQHDWESASRIIKKRKQGGKKSTVYIDGALIDEKKIRKETSRHDRPIYGEGSICHNFRVRFGALRSSQYQARKHRRDSTFARPQPLRVKNWKTL